MKTFNEWLELNEAGFFPNLFGKNKQSVQTTPAPAPALAPAAEEKGMNLDDFRRLMDGPNYDPARYAPAQQNKQQQAQEAEPAPKAEAQPQLSSSPKNPEEYLEEVANKYWGVEKELPPFSGLFSGELHESWNKYKQKNNPGDLHMLYYSVATKEENVGPIVEATKKAMVEILENKFRWFSFPKTDTAQLGPGRQQLANEKVIFIDGRKKSIGMVRVLAKGFEDRRGNLLAEASVLYMG